MQNYKNHIRFYTAHHFVFYPVILALAGLSVYFAFRGADHAALLWIFLALAFFVIGWLSFMLRQHYAMTGQNRTVVLEMRFRYYVLTHERLELVEDRLSFGQIAALRFASDAELAALMERTLKENLSPDEIKRSIKNWLPDNKRV
ncbi:DUF6526 family protein [Pedobacter psychroterrae]|uniref:Uncharacterized protein n=1 Tax=Pedobacter psychroterrae TaxID=2530453 RepID=A0A4R0NQX0_9SPHI|nr:DUF6526 family protein [Pedobacter psychroterrae]TCD03502.1 hypothetical protein EZ437_05930 [Pedobacter psychroterrae]